MSIDPKSQSVTSFFMIAAVIVMLALAWSVSRENPKETGSATPPETNDVTLPVLPAGENEAD